MLLFKTDCRWDRWRHNRFQIQRLVAGACRSPRLVIEGGQASIAMHDAKLDRHSLHELHPDLSPHSDDLLCPLLNPNIKPKKFGGSHFRRTARSRLDRAAP